MTSKETKQAMDMMIQIAKAKKVLRKIRNDRR